MTAQHPCRQGEGRGRASPKGATGVRHKEGSRECCPKPRGLELVAEPLGHSSPASSWCPWTVQRPDPWGRLTREPSAWGCPESPQTKQEPRRGPPIRPRRCLPACRVTPLLGPRVGRPGPPGPPDTGSRRSLPLSGRRATAEPGPPPFSPLDGAGSQGYLLPSPHKENHAFSKSGWFSLANCTLTLTDGPLYH